MSDYVMTAKEFCQALRGAVEQKTLYVMGCFGAPLTPKNKERYLKNYAYNSSAARAKKIKDATPDTFGFDCVCLVKGILWGWNADPAKVYGGAVYQSNGVPDIGTEKMIGMCSDVSEDFSSLTDGELLWSKGHVGVVVDAENGIAIECTPAWKDGVQKTAIGGVPRSAEANMYHTRTWTKHGKLPWIEYPKEPVTLYKVQVGAYKVRSNAEKKLAEVKSAGFPSAYIVEETK